MGRTKPTCADFTVRAGSSPTGNGPYGKILQTDPGGVQGNSQAVGAGVASAARGSRFRHGGRS